MFVEACVIKGARTEAAILVAAAVLLTALFAAPSRAAQFSFPSPAMSQYVGLAPNQNQAGGDHVLLFKLPRSISSQIQEQFDQQQQQQQQQLQLGVQQQLHNSPPLSSSPVHFQPLVQLHQPAMMNAEPLSLASSNEEHSVSLTIPLSSLKAPERNNLAKERVVFVSQPQTSAVDFRNAQTQQQEPRQSAKTTQMLEYLLPGDTQQQGQIQVDENGQQIDTSNQQLQDAAQRNQLSQQQRYTNLTSVIEQQVRKFLQEQQQAMERPSTTTMPTTTLVPTTTEQVQTQEYVWPTNQESGNSRNTPTQYLQQQQQQQQPQNHLGSPTSSSLSLLNRLASSSPDLLLRLRKLLHQTGSAQHARGQPMISFTASSALGNQESNNTNYSTQLLEHKPQVLYGRKEVSANKLYDEPSYSGAMENKNAPPGTFLNNHNLSSHEEIKIPLVVIAMPRILSVKRGQQATSAGSAGHDSMSNSSSSLATRLPNRSIIKHILSKTLAKSNFSASGDHSEDVNTNNRTFLYQLGLNHQPQGSNYDNSSKPIILLASGGIKQGAAPYTIAHQLTSTDHNDQSSAFQQQQQVDTTTSLPQHTMAPYARQFTVPVATPLVQQQNYVAAGNNHEQLTSYQQPQLEFNQTSSPTDYIGPSHAVAGLPTIAKNRPDLLDSLDRLISSIRQNSSTVSSSSDQLADGGENERVRLVQLVESGSQQEEHQELQQQQQQQLARYSKPNYEYQTTRTADQQRQPEFLYKFQPTTSLTSLEPDSSRYRTANAAERSVSQKDLVDFGLSRMRPLFQVGQLTNSADGDQQQLEQQQYVSPRVRRSRLGSEQLVEAQLGRPGRRRLLSRRFDRQRPFYQDQEEQRQQPDTFQGANLGRKSPKMVVMIV